MVEHRHRRRIRAFDREWPDSDHELVGQIETLPAGGEDAETRAVRQKGVDQFGGRVEDVLAVVEDEEIAPVTQVFGQLVIRGEPQAACDGVPQIGGPEGRQLGDRGAHRGRGGERTRQGRLPDATGTGHCDQARLAERLVDLGHFLVAAEEHPGILAERDQRGHHVEGG